jgi:hypothetical protein
MRSIASALLPLGVTHIAATAEVASDAAKILHDSAVTGGA